MPRLVHKSGPDRGSSFTIQKSRMTIGRDFNNDLQLVDGKVSRHHVEITCDRDTHFVEDLGSSNGTMLNGRNVQKAPLMSGDELLVGNTLLVFIDEGAEVGSTEVVAPAEEETSEFQTLADTSEINLTSKRFHAEREEDLERARRSLVMLYELAQSCGRSREVEELFEAVVSGLTEALEADRVYPILLESGPAGGEADAGGARSRKKGRGAGGWKPWLPERSAFAVDLVRAPVSSTVVEHVRAEGLSVLWNLKENEEMRAAASVSKNEIMTALCVPLAARGRMLGVIYADRLKGGQPFGREDLELITAAAGQVAAALENIEHLEELSIEKQHLEREVRGQYSLLGESQAMKEVFTFIERAAPTDSGVLILGQSGTGKELVARAIHYHSNRKGRAFEVLNCAALSESLIESELFGHVRGAFTGASADRPGRFELADRGTIFLDEIGELSTSCQTRLLRVLEQGETSRLGEARQRLADVRVIAATNRELEREVQEGRFRQDLYYRLNVLSVKLPLLSGRGDDILLLARSFLQSIAEAAGRRHMRLTPEVEETLKRYPWPGNVRELRNIMERMVVMAPGEEVALADLPAEFHQGGAPAGRTASDERLVWRLAEMERVHIMKALEATGGNKKQAAELLGIDRSTLYAKLRTYGVALRESGVTPKDA